MTPLFHGCRGAKVLTGFVPFTVNSSGSFSSVTFFSLSLSLFLFVSLYGCRLCVRFGFFFERRSRMGMKGWGCFLWMGTVGGILGNEPSNQDTLWY